MGFLLQHAGFESCSWHTTSGTCSRKVHLLHLQRIGVCDFKEQEFVTVQVILWLA